MNAHLPIAPFYRRYELPWSATDEVDRRFKRLLRVLLIALAVIGAIIPLLPKPDVSKRAVAELPEAVVRLIVEKPLPPPPPPPKPEPVPEKPEEPRPAPVKPAKPVEVQERVRQVGLLAMKDDLAELRQVIDPKDLSKTDIKTVGPDVRSERNLITSKVGAASGGINTATLSRGFGGGAGAIGTHTTASVAVPASVSGKGDGSGVRRSGSSGKAARSREEIEQVFDRNKGALYALYTRAQRDNAELQGKLVLELTIAPAGDVTMVRVVSSELKDPELERKIVARVKLFRFEAKDVETITATKPIEFFPA